MIRLMLLLALLPLPAVADTALTDRYRGPVDTCYNDARRARYLDVCYGLLSTACTEGEAQGQTTLGLSQCWQAEAAFWDEKLNAEYGVTMARMRDGDDHYRSTAPQYAIMADQLRSAQRAWIAFRDAHCASVGAVAGSGSIRQITFPSCLSALTFSRVQDLIQLREP